MTAKARGARSAGDDQVDGLGPLALLVGLDVETDALSLVEALEPRLLDRRDMHEHVASAVVRLDEAVATLAVEKLHHPRLRHLQSSRTAPPPAPTARRLGRTFPVGKASAASATASVTPPAPHPGRRNVTACHRTRHQLGSAGKARLGFKG